MVYRGRGGVDGGAKQFWDDKGMEVKKESVTRGGRGSIRYNIDGRQQIVSTSLQQKVMTTRAMITHH
jgi:hypothetical protein